LAMRPAPFERLERMMLVVQITRDPHTERFRFQSSVREQDGPLDPLIIRDGSPTLFAASVHAWSQTALEHFLMEVGERWDDDLERAVVDSDELRLLLEPPRE
jgi:hypothetical protein